jgi:hypothetical protein
MPNSSCVSLLAVSLSNVVPGDSFDHVGTMVGKAEEVSVGVRSILEHWPQGRPPIGLVVLPVLALSGSGAGRRMLNLLPTRPLIARDLAIDLSRIGANPSVLSPADPRLSPLIDLCAERQFLLATSTIEAHPAMPDVLFHTGFVLGPKGLVLRSPKVFARSGPSITILSSILARYTEVFGEEAILPVVETAIGRIAVLVEGEIDHDEAIATLAIQRPDIVCHPTLRTGEHPRTTVDMRLSDVSLRLGATVVSACSTGERVDDNRGGWLFQPFSAGTSIWSSEGMTASHAPASDGAVAWTPASF